MWAALAKLATVLSLAVAGPALADGKTSLPTRLADTLEGFRDRHGFPGATAAIVLPDGTVATAATGLADIEENRAMTPGTRMLAASIGKTFVAATILSLESEGLLSQSDLLAEFLGDRAWFADLPNVRTITIKHLLHHQSGLPDHTHLVEFQKAAAAQIASGVRAITPEELLAFVTGRRPLFKAGTSWAYSDTGYVLLGLVIEEVTGRRYYDVVGETFLTPLDLSDTIPADRPHLPGLAVGYTIPDNAYGLPVRTAEADGRLVWDPTVEWTGGGFVSTSSDLARWGHALFAGQAMKAPYLDRLLDGVPVSPATPDILYGAGVAISAQTPLGPVYGHGGWIPAYVSSLRHYADHRVTVAFQINSDAGVIDGGSDHVAELETALARLAIEGLE
ncbi:serine hydrolase domain-containing protein [Roseovarius nitratireducens]|uniref:serine hydrolase domain-containing protein n=1 Tax=Roseovarius nitratireducens TaxID=2044597 RepID=UPI000CE177F5|nr:serine hydrolase domain-containing protein [Roseovarius nitratireducens]